MDYLLLTTMLLQGRFDLYLRGLFGIAPEMATRGERYQDLAVEQHMLLHYSFCEAFYVSRSAPRLAARLTARLERISFLVDLNLRPRTVIELDNPFLLAWIPLERKELWFDPRRLP
jgi:hypothetical protein